MLHENFVRCLLQYMFGIVLVFTRLMYLKAHVYAEKSILSFVTKLVQLVSHTLKKNVLSQITEILGSRY